MSPSPSPTPSPKILIVRRDNIGDLVCTTPLIAALRQRFPDAWLGALVNSYNAPVLDGNTDLNEVFVYTKAKHRGATESLPGIFWRRLMMMKRLREMMLDDVIVATPSPQPRVVNAIRWLRPKRMIGFGDVAGLDISLPVSQADRHEVEDVFRIAQLYGIEGTPPPCRVMSMPKGNNASATAGLDDKHRHLTIGLHISARKPSQRWAAERFAELVDAINRYAPVAKFVLLWSPGAQDNPLHPGDDAKAREVMDRLSVLPALQQKVHLQPTAHLTDLIRALANCDMVICADGGAMHLAAGLGKPIVCLFGNSGAERWRPWGVTYRLLQKPSLDVNDITAREVFDALLEVLEPNGSTSSVSGGRAP